MNKVILITGVANGIGKAAAKKFSENNWNVIGVDITKNKNKYCNHLIQADVSNTEDIKNLFKNFPFKPTRLDALVNNAAIQVCKIIEQTTIDDWDSTINTNLRSVFAMTKYALPLLIKSRGSIVNISSVHALATSDSMSAYAASKGGITAFTRSSAIELGKHSIRVNAILPGAVNTKMLKEGLDRGHLKTDNTKELITELANKHIMGKIGEPRDIAELIYFLCDKSSSSFITGQCFVADGGATAKLSTE